MALLDLQQGKKRVRCATMVELLSVFIAFTSLKLICTGGYIAYSPEFRTKLGKTRKNMWLAWARRKGIRKVEETETGSRSTAMEPEKVEPSKAWANVERAVQAGRKTKSIEQSERSGNEKGK